MEYFNTYNVIDLAQYVGMTTTVVLTMLKYNYNDNLRIFAAGPALGFIFAKSFFWMGLWERLGLYTQMTVDASFLLFPIFWLVVICCFTFGLPLAVMDFSRE